MNNYEKYLANIILDLVDGSHHEGDFMDKFGMSEDAAKQMVREIAAIKAKISENK